nr:hypothetical protein [Cellulosimicrobium sp. MM]
MLRPDEEAGRSAPTRTPDTREVDVEASDVRALEVGVEPDGRRTLDLGAQRVEDGRPQACEQLGGGRGTRGRAERQDVVGGALVGHAPRVDDEGRPGAGTAFEWWAILGSNQ